MAVKVCLESAPPHLVLLTPATLPLSQSLHVAGSLIFAFMSAMRLSSALSARSRRRSASGSPATAGAPPASVGFTFSFPVDQTGIAQGTLLEWTKGFTNPGVVGNEVVGLLQAAFARRGLRAVARALVNDTVGTLMAAAYTDPSARIGVILGTGTNACYVEQTARIPKWRGAAAGPGARMLINMEWGGFGSGATRMLPFHGVDDALDAASPNEGKQRLEKMIGGMYLGELVRLLMEQLVSAGALFVDDDAAAGGGGGGDGSASKPSTPSHAAASSSLSPSLAPSWASCIIPAVSLSLSFSVVK